MAAFDAYDKDKSGKIDARELGSLAADLNMPFLDDDELAAAVAVLDEDASGLIDKSEFVNWWKKKVRAAPLHASCGAVLCLRCCCLYVFHQHACIHVCLLACMYACMHVCMQAQSAVTSDLDRKLMELAKAGKEKHHQDIHMAAWAGKDSMVQKFLELDPELAHAEDKTEFGVRAWMFVFMYVCV